MKGPARFVRELTRICEGGGVTIKLTDRKRGGIQKKKQPKGSQCQEFWAVKGATWGGRVLPEHSICLGFGNPLLDNPLKRRQVTPDWLKRGEKIKTIIKCPVNSPQFPQN